MLRKGFAYAAMVLFGACAGTQTPEHTARSFGRALVDGRVGDAYDHLASDYRRRVPLSEFRGQVEANGGEMRELGRLLASSGESGDVTAAVTLADGSTVELVLRDGEWRIEGNPANYYDQSTPRRALRSFVRAMERRRYEVVMRFVPESDREGMSVERMQAAWEGEGREEIERLIAVLRDNLDEPIEEIGDRATMAYGEGSTVQFIREDGAWKIEDPS
ncbi:MAG: hypothetical protein AAF411_19180 [Myxococcota bacterium]